MGWSIQDGAVVQHQATVPGGTPAAGYSTLWLRSSDGHVIRTDSSAVEHDLESGGGGAEAGIPGALWNNCLIYMDAGDRNCFTYSGSSVSGVIELVSDTTDSSPTAITLVDGHFDFDGAAGSGTSVIDFGTLSAAQEDIFEAGGSVSGWFRAESDGENSLAWVVGTADDSNTKGWYLYVGDTSGDLMRLQFYQNRATTDTYFNTDRSVREHHWTHFCITYDGSDPASYTPTLYLNGQAATLSTQTDGSGAVASDSGQKFLVGNRPDSSRTFDGQIDCIQLWDRVLSAAEVRQLYNIRSRRFRPSLIGLDAQDATADAQSVYVQGGVGGATSGKGATVYVIGGATAGDDAGSVRIIGGEYTGSTAGKVSGSVDVAGGDSNSGTGDAGHVTLTGGAKGSVGGAAGSITITGGSKSGSYSGAVGGVAIKTGTGGTNASGAELRIEVQALTTGTTVGDLVLQGGTNDGSGHPGDIRILGGDSTGQNAGEIVLTAGDATGSGEGGHIRLTSGSSANYYTGSIYITTPAQTSGSRGTGSITLTVGDTYGNYGNAAGTLTLQGSNHTNTLGSGDAGSIACYAGDNASNDSAGNAYGGDFIGAAGDQTGSGTAVPGSVKLSGGSKTAGNATGGHVYLYGGNGFGSGNGGNVLALTGDPGGSGQNGYFEVRTRGTATNNGWRVTEFDAFVTTVNTAQTVLTIGTLTANGENLAVDVFVQGQGTASTTEAASARKIVTFYRDGGTVSAMTYHLDDNQFVGSGTAMTVTLTISGNNVLLQVTGQTGVTVNWSGIIKVKKGGA